MKHHKLGPEDWTRISQRAAAAAEAALQQSLLGATLLASPTSGELAYCLLFTLAWPMCTSSVHSCCCHHCCAAATVRPPLLLPCRVKTNYNLAC